MAPASQLVLPVALGLSIATVTAFVFYYIFKKDQENENEDKKIKTSRINTIEVNVPKAIVPALIGRSGSNIKEIERKSGAMIHFKKFSDKDYDVCIIRGRIQTSQLAETMVHEFIKQQPEITQESVEVPNWACGRIIGSGGENIMDISHRSGARIKLEGLPGDNNTMRQINIKGTKEQIKIATELIENCVAQEKCRREINQSQRSSRHTAPSAPATPAAPAPLSPTADHDNETPTGDATPKYKRPKNANGSTIEVYVSAVSSPSRFWVQFVGPQVTQLDELVNHMTEYYGNKENRAAHKLESVSVGQIVAAVFRHDGRWYRARVHDIRPNEFDATQQVADVFYVDYGDSEYVATHELCELRADLLRLRFQAMECFLAGISPAGYEPSADSRWPRWNQQAIERFEELTQVARWKPLMSKTCTYKKTPTIDGEKDKEIPGIKLYDVTEEGELDICATLIAEGWGVEASLISPRASPPHTQPHPTTPFGDLSNSRVLGMLSGAADPGAAGARAASMPKDHKDDAEYTPDTHDDFINNERISSAKSLSSGLEAADKVKSISNFDINYGDLSRSKPNLNGSHENFLHMERQNVEKDASTHTLTSDDNRNELKANINRIDSHHNNLESLAK